MSWSTSELRVRLAPRNRLSPSSKIFYCSEVVLLLWIFYGVFLSCVCYAFVRVCLYVLCGHLLGKGWPLGSRLWCLTVSLSLSHWYPGSGAVLDCIDSWYLHPYFLYFNCVFRCHASCVLCHPHGAWGLSVVCECGISWSYSLLPKYDGASGSDLTPCIKIDKPLVVYRFSGNGLNWHDINVTVIWQ